MTASSDLQLERLPLTPDLRAALTAWDRMLRLVLIFGWVIVAGVLLFMIARVSGMRWQEQAFITGVIVLLVGAAVRGNFRIVRCSRCSRTCAMECITKPQDALWSRKSSR